METFPWSLLVPKRQKTRLVGQALSGPVSLSGRQQSARADGGGFWVTELQDILLHRTASALCARAWSGLLAEGFTEVIVPIYDRAQAPFPNVDVAKASSARSFFEEDLTYQDGPLIVASVHADAALRATTLDLHIGVTRHSEPQRLLSETGAGLFDENGAPMLREDSGPALLGGEHFSIDHPVLGWRLYRITKVVDVVAAVHSVQIAPPLREAVTTAEAAEFDVPRCVMKLAPGASDAFEPTMDSSTFPTISATFIEA